MLPSAGYGQRIDPSGRRWGYMRHDALEAARPRDVDVRWCGRRPAAAGPTPTCGELRDRARPRVRHGLGFIAWSSVNGDHFAGSRSTRGLIARPHDAALGPGALLSRVRRAPRM